VTQNGKGSTPRGQTKAEREAYERGFERVFRRKKPKKGKR
jgi:hypothetical protein